MKKINYPCPCGGKIKWKKDKVVIEGINCGVLDVEYCQKCGEEYLPEKSLEIVENKLKKQVFGSDIDKGKWDLTAEELRRRLKIKNTEKNGKNKDWVK